MNNLSKIIKITTHLVVAFIAVLAFYYLKYRPMRNDYHQVIAVNQELKNQVEAKNLFISTLWDNYVVLSKIPRYTIDQHLDRIKVKRNSTLEFIPQAELKVIDSLNQEKAIILNDTILYRRPRDNIRYRTHWWQFWRGKQTD